MILDPNLLLPIQNNIEPKNYGMAVYIVKKSAYNFVFLSNLKNRFQEKRF